MLESLLGNSQKKTLLLKSCDAYMARSRALSSNIANATTPGYQRREVQFEEALKKSLSHSNLKGKRTDSGHLQLGGGTLESVEHEIVRSYDPTLASGVNNVDIDKEMAELAENQIAFKFALRRLSSGYSKINAAISLKPVQK